MEEPKGLRSTSEGEKGTQAKTEEKKRGGRVSPSRRCEGDRQVEMGKGHTCKLASSAGGRRKSVEEESHRKIGKGKGSGLKMEE